MMEFHISRGARDRYRFAEPLFALTGNVVFASLSASRAFTRRMNETRNADANPELAVHAGALYTMGLIDEASHAVLAQYRERIDPGVMTDAIAWFSREVGAEAVEKLLLGFVLNFPGVKVYRGQESAEEWLDGSSDGTPHRAAALEELILLWMANRNQAFAPFAELFEDRDLAARTAYEKVTARFADYFATRPLVEVELPEGLPAAAGLDLAADSPRDATDAPGVRPGRRPAARPGVGKDASGGRPGTVSVSIFELLRAPALAAPGSLTGQLAQVQKMWKPLLGTSLQRGLGVAAEILREEN